VGAFIYSSFFFTTRYYPPPRAKCTFTAKRNRVASKSSHAFDPTDLLSSIHESADKFKMAFTLIAGLERADL
jgi:hypothetical protein